MVNHEHAGAAPHLQTDSLKTRIAMFCKDQWGARGATHAPPLHRRRQTRQGLCTAVLAAGGDSCTRFARAVATRATSGGRSRCRRRANASP
jgi:hypothetical protein